MWFDLIFKTSYTTCRELVKLPLVSGKRARFLKNLIGVSQDVRCHFLALTAICEPVSVPCLAWELLQDCSSVSFCSSPRAQPRTCPRVSPGRLSGGAGRTLGLREGRADF